jgi:hypothetical protein
MTQSRIEHRGLLASCYESMTNFHFVRIQINERMKKMRLASSRLFKKGFGWAMAYILEREKAISRPVVCSPSSSKASPDARMTTSRPHASRRWHRLQPQDHGDFVRRRHAATNAFGTVQHWVPTECSTSPVIKSGWRAETTDHIPQVYVTTT